MPLALNESGGPSHDADVRRGGKIVNERASIAGILYGFNLDDTRPRSDATVWQQTIHALGTVTWLITISGHSWQRCGKGIELRPRDGRLELE